MKCRTVPVGTGKGRNFPYTEAWMGGDCDFADVPICTFVFLWGDLWQSNENRKVAGQRVPGFGRALTGRLLRCLAAMWQRIRTTV